MSRRNMKIKVPTLSDVGGIVTSVAIPVDIIKIPK